MSLSQRTNQKAHCISIRGFPHGLNWFVICALIGPQGSSATKGFPSAIKTTTTVQWRNKAQT